MLEIKVPAFAESITEASIAVWLKKEGDFVEKDEALCEFETDKATMEYNAEADGILHIVAKEGQTLKIGELFAKIDTSKTQNDTKEPQKPQEKTEIAQKEVQKTTPQAKTDAKTTPLAENILSDKGIDPKTLKGTGENGKITKADALAADTKPTAAPVALIPAKVETAQPNTANQHRTQRTEPMSKLRKVIAKRLVAVKNETAMLTTFNEVDMKPIMDLRAKYKDKFKEIHGVGLGFMSFFTKAACLAMRDFPAVNAAISGENIVYSDYVDVSIAVSAPKGLVVPIIRNAEQLGLAQIEKAVLDLATKARENKLTIDEMTGGTFTITNGGVFGSMLSTPIINAPQSAILGMHNIVQRAVVVNGEIVVRPIMYVALSYDHRIIDGRESVGFLFKMKELLEDPSRMLLDV